MVNKSTPNEKPLTATPAYTISAEDTVSKLHVDPLQGLTDQTIKTRQQKWGANQVGGEEGVSWAKILLGTYHLSIDILCQTLTQRL